MSGSALAGKEVGLFTIDMVRHIPSSGFFYRSLPSTWQPEKARTRPSKQETSVILVLSSL